MLELLNMAQSKRQKDHTDPRTSQEHQQLGPMSSPYQMTRWLASRLLRLPPFSIAPEMMATLFRRRRARRRRRRLQCQPHLRRRRLILCPVIEMKTTMLNRQSRLLSSGQ